MPQLHPLAEALVAAHRHHALLSPAEWTGQPADAEAAYGLQQQVGDTLGWWPAGSLPRSWKSGGPGPDALRHAPLGESGVLQADGETLDWRARPWPGAALEAEIALRLGQPVTPAMAAEVDEASAWALLDGLAVAVEFAASRWASAASADQQLADGLSHGGLGLGPWQAPAPRNWAAQALALTRSGEPAQPFTGTHPLGHPGAVLPGLLRHLTRHGASAPAGTLVTTGSWNGALQVARGQQVTVAFAGLPPLTVLL
ncbi:fumarylacetoacetate hydrolase family protein [Ideonella azotifigens]|uniref:Fumarylacetoacetase-like C-terminal domain-containing protein n=1 Tax=Ideonella azotifigens TaxID=513160 RepID=A0ABP3UU90_9BURK|nr:fumarylacetoacetate hydrolase family protein [Ideonella azotifigens]MCD2341843.1 fumarylacetoacetate hydrolase family protein [Ideonella azotifigens]